MNMNPLKLHVHVICHIEHHVIVIQGSYLAQDAGGGYHLVALTHGCHQLLVLLLALPLWPNGDKIEKDEQTYQKKDLE